MSTKEPKEKQSTTERIIKSKFICLKPEYVDHLSLTFWLWGSLDLTLRS